jgi:hypothetical protein
LHFDDVYTPKLELKILLLELAIENLIYINVI